MRLSLANIVAEPSLGLRMVVEPDDCLERVVEGVHSIEIANPTRYMRAGWVMLCNGVRLKNRPDEQRRLIAELDHGGITALGFGLGEFFQRLPAALLEEAEKRELPLFVIEGPTPFREIISFVGQATIDTDVYHLRRAMVINDELMDCLAEPSADGAIVKRLAEALGGVAATFSTAGELQLEFGGEGHRLWALCDGAMQLTEVADGQHLAWVAPILADGRPRRWLVFSARRQSQPERLVRRVVHTAQRLLELVEVGRSAAAAELESVRGELLIELLAGSPLPLAVRLEDRMRWLGINLEQPSRVAVFSPCGGDGSPTRLARKLGWLGHSYLLAEHEGAFVALVEGDQLDFDGLARELADEGHPFQVGVGAPVDSAEGVSGSFRDARLAVAELRREATKPGVLDVEGLGLAAVLAREDDKGDLRRRAERVIGDLREHSFLHETLIAFLDCDLDVRTTAERLHLHPNSLRYRLGRIEDQLGRSFNSVADVADLYLATTLDRVGSGDRSAAS